MLAWYKLTCMLSLISKSMHYLDPIIMLWNFPLTLPPYTIWMACQCRTEEMFLLQQSWICAVFVLWPLCLIQCWPQYDLSMTFPCCPDWREEFEYRSRFYLKCLCRQIFKENKKTTVIHNYPRVPLSFTLLPSLVLLHSWFFFDKLEVYRAFGTQVQRLTMKIYCNRK